MLLQENRVEIEVETRNDTVMIMPTTPTTQDTEEQAANQEENKEQTELFKKTGKK